MDPSFDSLDDVMAYINRRRAEGAKIVMTPAARAYFELIVEQGGHFFSRILLSDDGQCVTVDLAADNDGGHVPG
jgi:hypothetical protein